MEPRLLGQVLTYLLLLVTAYAAGQAARRIRGPGAGGIQAMGENSIRFLGWSWTLPLALVIFVVAMVAALADELFGLVARKRRRRRKALKEELKALRAQSRAR